MTLKSVKFKKCSVTLVPHQSNKFAQIVPCWHLHFQKWMSKMLGCGSQKLWL